MDLINTTHGRLDTALLARSVKFEDKPREFVVTEEWRLLAHNTSVCEFCASEAPDAPFKDLLVRNNVWVHLKDASVVADGIAGSV